MHSVSEVYWINLPSVHDNRGILTSVESGMDIPFEITRIFYMHHVISERGGHAHVDTDQVVIAVSGSFTIELFDGRDKVNYFMDDPTRGLYIPRMIFIRLYDFSAHGVCQVLANTHYDIKKSIRNINDYLNSLK